MSLALSRHESSVIYTGTFPATAPHKVYVADECHGRGCEADSDKLLAQPLRSCENIWRALSANSCKCGLPYTS